MKSLFDWREIRAKSKLLRDPPGIWPRPIIVVGPGRSGTSFITEILVNHFKIPMGPLVLGDTPANPGSRWEDLFFTKLNDEFLWGGLDYGTFAKRLDRLINVRRRDALAGDFLYWGFKDPTRFGLLFSEYLSRLSTGVLGPPLFIHCRRNIRACAKGFHQKINDFSQRYPTEELLVEFLEGVDKRLLFLLSSQTTLDFSFNHPIPRELAIKCIERWLGSPAIGHLHDEMHKVPTPEFVQPGHRWSIDWEEMEHHLIPCDKNDKKSQTSLEHWPGELQFTSKSLGRGAAL